MRGLCRAMASGIEADASCSAETIDRGRDVGERKHWDDISESLYGRQQLQSDLSICLVQGYRLPRVNSLVFSPPDPYLLLLVKSSPAPFPSSLPLSEP